MATYGSRDKNRFKIQGSNSEYYPLVDSKTGTITVKSPNIGRGILDRTVGTIEATGSKAKKFQSTPGSTTTDELRLFSNQATTNNVRNQAIKTATKAQIELGLSVDEAKARSNQLINTGTTATTPVTTTSDSSTSDSPTSEGEANLNPFQDPNIAADKQQGKGSFGYWAYPTNIGKNDQDFIKFSMIEYLTKPLAALQTFERFDNIDRKKTILGTVVLPIQPSITDTSTVDWQQEGINPLQGAGARIALAASSSDPSTALPAEFNNLVNELKGEQTSESFKNYLRLWAAGQAVGVNLASRVAGAVVNPNIELLFNGPQLRPFSFSFRLSPRDENEAKQVKSIIRFFKQGMAVRKAAGGVFLKTPNIFDIQYCYKNENTIHPSLNQIKTCALTSCTVDYTPDGSYATFTDGTMTSYSLTLQFSELEPIFDTDYAPIDTKTGINEISY